MMRIVIFGLVFGLISFSFVWEQMDTWRLGPNVTKTWLPTPAHVQAARKIETPNSEPVMSLPVIKYSYQVNDTTYSGSNYTVPDPQPMKSSQVDEILSEFPVGQDVTAYYNPQDPSQACLAKRDSKGTKNSKLLLFMATAFVAMIYIVSTNLNRRMPRR